MGIGADDEDKHMTEALLKRCGWSRVLCPRP